MPKGGQYTVGRVDGDVRLSNMRRDKAEEVISLLSPTLAVSHVRYQDGSRNRTSVTFTVAYGPVKGGWPSDVRKKVHRACQLAGTAAQIDKDFLSRTVTGYCR